MQLVLAFISQHTNLKLFNYYMDIAAMKKFIAFFCCFYSLFISSISFALSKPEVESLVYSTQF